MTTYPGGKSQAGTYQTIINQIPPHRVYVEPFLGMGGIMRTKQPAQCSIGIDSDGDVVKQWANHGIPNLRVVLGNGIDYLIDHGFSDDTVIYCDPPYVMSARASSRPIYNCELTDDDHRRLLGVIKRIQAPVLISGYASSLYFDTLADWRVVTYQAVTRAGRVATEYLWMNFPQPSALHDYRYLGRNFRERERIKRQQARWRKRIENMKPLERYAMLSVIQLASPLSAMKPPDVSL